VPGDCLLEKIVVVDVLPSSDACGDESEFVDETVVSCTQTSAEQRSNKRRRRGDKRRWGRNAIRGSEEEKRGGDSWIRVGNKRGKGYDTDMLKEGSKRKSGREGQNTLIEARL
jgi:hypothetical protein